jgi:hypothetical protein
MHEHARPRAAHLALVEQDAQLDAFQRLFEGRVGEDDVGRLAAQFQRGRNELCAAAAATV